MALIRVTTSEEERDSCGGEGGGWVLEGDQGLEEGKDAAGLAMAEGVLLGY